MEVAKGRDISCRSRGQVVCVDREGGYEEGGTEVPGGEGVGWDMVSRKGCA